MGERGLYLGDVLGADGQRGEALRLDADALTTHGVIVGMTGDAPRHGVPDPPAVDDEQTTG